MPTKLTAPHLARLQPRDKQYEMTDAVVPGLVFRVQQSGMKRWGFRYRSRDGGPLRYVVLGGHPELSLEGARLRARAMRQVVVDGGDPAQERDDRRAEPTLGELWADYHQHHEKKPKTLVEDARRWNRHLTSWSDRKASQIPAAEAVAIIRRVARGSGPCEANKLLTFLRHLYNWARDEKLITCTNPFSRIKREPERRRECSLSASEYAVLRASVDLEEDPVWRSYFLLLMLTGCRRSELLGTRWDWVRLDGDPMIRFPSVVMKGGKPHELPLTSEMIHIIAALPSRGRSPWLFAGKGGPRREPKRAWNRIRTRARLPDLRLHDLRHAAGTSMGDSGANAFVVQNALGHADITTSSRYVHTDLAAVRRALQQHAHRVMGGHQGGRA